MQFKLPMALTLLSLATNTLQSSLDPRKANIIKHLSPPVKNSGTAIWDTDGNSHFFYQTSDGAVHELVGDGVTNGGNYQDSVIIPSGQVAIGTPMAIVAVGTLKANMYDVSSSPFPFLTTTSTSTSTIKSPAHSPIPLKKCRMYLYGTDNTLQEWALNSGTPQNSMWSKSGLCDYHLPATPGAKYISALTEPANSAGIRVGYLDPNGYLAEAWYNGQWNTAFF